MTGTPPATDAERLALLRRCDAYLDAVPRPDAEVVDVGPLRAFASTGPWPFYVRPRAGLDLRAVDAVRADDVRAAADVLAARGQEVSFEWVVDLAPGLGDVLRDVGFAVSTHPLLVLPDPGRSVTGPLVDHRGDGVRVRLVGPDDDLVPALQVAEVGFAAPGTAVEAAGPAERDAADVSPEVLAHVAGRLRARRTVLAVVEDPALGVVASGAHQPVGPTTEVVGVATLPAARRRGHAARLVRVLIDEAAAHGCTLALLSAADDDVARVYERLGFVRVGHVGAAAPADPAPR